MLRLTRFRIRSLPSLSVETKLFFVVSFVVTLVLAVFSALGYLHERSTLQVLHQHLMQPGPAVFGNALEEHQEHLALIQTALAQTSSRHLIHWGITVVVLVLALHWAVSRIVISPAQQIMAGLHHMELGTWNPNIPIRSRDEMGQLTQKLNEADRVMSRRVDQWRGAERLATLALVSNSVSSELEQISKAIRAAVQGLGAADASNGHNDHSKVIKGLAAQATRLEALETALDEKFLRTLEGVRAGQRDEECE